MSLGSLFGSPFHLSIILLLRFHFLSDFFSLSHSDLTFVDKIFLLIMIAIHVMYLKKKRNKKKWVSLINVLSAMRGAYYEWEGYRNILTSSVHCQ